MNTRRSMALVAGREVREALRRKSFWVVFLVLLAGSTAAMVVPALVSSDATTRYDVAVVGDAPTLEANLRSLGQALEAKVDVTTVATEATARQKVKDKGLDLAVVPGRRPSVIVRAGGNDRLVGAARQALAATTTSERLQAAGLSPAQVQRALAVPAPMLDEVAVDTESRRAAGIAASVLVYILLLSLMIQVANGTAVEKANRVSEVLVPVVRPVSLLFGKVIGIGIIGVAILTAGLAPVIVKLALGGDLPGGIGATLAGGAAWFVLGSALYLTLAATLGSLVERQEEAGSVISPLTFALIGTFFVAQGGPDSALGTVLAYVPLSSPLVVPARIAIGASTPVELVASLLILLVTIALAVRFGSAAYGRAIVRTGRRLKLGEVLGAA